MKLELQDLEKQVEAIPKELKEEYIDELIALDLGTIPLDIAERICSQCRAAYEPQALVYIQFSPTGIHLRKVEVEKEGGGYRFYPARESFCGNASFVLTSPTLSRFVMGGCHVNFAL